MELTDQQLKKYMPQIKQVCEEYAIDDIQIVVDDVKEEYKRISEGYEAKGRSLPEVRYFHKALGIVCSQLGQFDGERYDIFIIAYSDPRDWNANEREKVLKAWHSGPKARDNIKKQGQVATMKKEGKEVIVSRIDRYGVTKDGKFFVIAGKELEGEEDPVPISTDPYLRDGKTENRRHTWPLNPRWNINMYGIAIVGDGFKQYEARVYGDFADPKHDNFLPKIAPAFRSYKAVLGLDNDNTTQDVLRFNFINAITPLDEEDTPEELVFNLVDAGAILSYKEHAGSLSEEDKKKFFLVDLDDIEDFHDEVMVQRDEHGEVIKTRSGYDATHWDRMGIGMYYLTRIKETSIGNSSLRFSDWTNQTNGAFTNTSTQFFEIDESILPREVIISFRTTRKPTRWDSENKIEVEDPINGDVTLGNLMGINTASNILEG